MRRFGVFFILLVFVASAGFFAACGNGGGGTELITNGGFETGDLTGWTVETYSPDASDFLLADSTELPMMPKPDPTGIVLPPKKDPVTLAGPSEGDWYVVSNQNTPTATALLQSFTVPEGDTSVVLTFDMFVLDTSEEGPINAGGLDPTLGTNQHARVDILSEMAEPLDTGDGVVLDLYLDVDGYEPVLPYISYSFDLSEDLTAGETYQLRFAEVDNLSPLHVGVDNVSIESE